MLFKDWNQLWVTSRVHPMAIKLFNLARVVIISTTITSKIGVSLSVNKIQVLGCIRYDDIVNDI